MVIRSKVSARRNLLFKRFRTKKKKKKFDKFIFLSHFGLSRHLKTSIRSSIQLISELSLSSYYLYQIMFNLCETEDETWKSFWKKSHFSIKGRTNFREFLIAV